MSRGGGRYGRLGGSFGLRGGGERSHGQHQALVSSLLLMLMLFYACIDHEVLLGEEAASFS